MIDIPTTRWQGLRLLAAVCIAWVVIAAVVATAGTRAACPLPSARGNHSMVFDEARHMLLLFGGVGNGPEPNNQLWGWDGADWQLLADNGPPPRLDAVMVYDAARERTVLFGGQNFPTFYGDTWEWDGVAWTHVTDDGPGNRAHTAAAFDRARGKIILFGGFDPIAQHHLDDTWEWNGAAWTQLNVPGPSARGAHSMGYDEKHEVVLVFGGLQDRGPQLRDTWTWDGATWTRVDETGPVVLAGRVLTSLGADGSVMFFGGSAGGKPQKITYLWDGAHWLGFTGPSPSARSLHGIAYDTDRATAVLFGGDKKGNKAVRDMWEFTSSGWVKLPKCP